MVCEHDSKDNYLGGLRKDSELCTESLFFVPTLLHICQKSNPKVENLVLTLAIEILKYCKK